MKTNMKENNFDQEYVYMMINDDFDNKFKFGFSKNPYERKRQLSKTNLARPMELFYVWEVSNMIKAEAIIHHNYASVRDTRNREFFYIDKDLYDNYGNFQTSPDVKRVCLEAHVEEITDILEASPIEIYSKLWGHEYIRQYLMNKRRRNA